MWRVQSWGSCGACAVGLVLALLGVAGCEAGAGTVVVQVRTELLPEREFSEVRTRLRTADGGEVADVRGAAAAHVDWGMGVRVAEVPALPSGRYRATVSALGAGGEVRVERPVSLIVEDGTVVVTVLLTRDCVDVVCPDPGGDPAATACVAGRCVAEECVEERAESCAIDECETDTDCPATGPCARPVCLPSGACFAEPDHGACGADEVCHPDDGCLPAASCEAPVCRLVPAQCGCGPGEGCYTNAMAMPECQPAGGLPQGAACALDNDCAPGHACLGRDGVEPIESRCRRFCAGPSDCAAPRRCVDIGIAALRLCLGAGCDLVEGTGCPDDRACQPLQLDSDGAVVTTCRPAGASQRQDTCAAPADCGAGLACAGIGDQPRCQPYCREDADCGPLGHCIESPAIAGGAIGECDAACDPLADPSGCPTGQVCRIIGDNARDGTPAGASYCGTEGSAPVGAPCGSADDCVAGSYCDPRGGSPTCLAFCDLDAPSCAAGTCMPLNIPTTLGGRELGACAL